MKVYQVPGNPKNYYFVKDFQEFLNIMGWMKQNNVEYQHESSSMVHGVGFSVRKNLEWFLLRWQ